MNQPHEERARAYLEQLHARHLWPGGFSEEDVTQLAALLRQVVVEERQACVVIVEETVRLFGSHTAEHAALRIRARDEGSGT